MTDIIINKAILSNRLYFKEEDIINGTVDTLNARYFSYDLGETIYSTMEYNEQDKLYSVPAGAWHKVPINEIVDTRPKFNTINWPFDGTLRPEQQLIADKIFPKKDKLYSGLIQAGCSFGKSFVGAYLLANYGKPTIIICHTVLLAKQWRNLLRLLMPTVKIGLVGDSVEDIQDITIGIYKSVGNRMSKLENRFEVMIVDEAHKCPAATFSRVVNDMNVRVRIALSATPTRRDGLHVVLSDYFGPNKLVGKDSGKLIPAVEICRANVVFPIRNPKLEWAKQLTKLAKNEKYINLIAEKAAEKVEEGRAVLIISERIEFLEQLEKIIPNSKLVIGKTKDREKILDSVGKEVDVILTTKIFDEGISCHRLDTIFLTSPSSNFPLLEQRIGRILRTHEDKLSPLIVDFWLDGNIVQAQQGKRQQWYIQRKYKILPMQTT